MPSGGVSFQALRVVIVALSEIVKRAPRSLVVKDHVTMNKPVVSLYFLLIYQVMCILTWKHNGANRQAFQVLKSWWDFTNHLDLEILIGCDKPKIHASYAIHFPGKIIWIQSVPKEISFIEVQQGRDIR